jgi:hypothetical protein
MLRIVFNYTLLLAEGQMTEGWVPSKSSDFWEIWDRWLEM